MWPASQTAAVFGLRQVYLEWWHKSFHATKKVNFLNMKAGTGASSSLVQLRRHVLYFACGRVSYFTWLPHVLYFTPSLHPILHVPESLISRSRIPSPCARVPTSKSQSHLKTQPNFYQESVVAWMCGNIFVPRARRFFWSAGRHCTWSDVKPLTKVKIQPRQFRVNRAKILNGFVETEVKFFSRSKN